MVVADEDPPRKRSRLSLKSSRKGENAPSPDEPPTLESAGATPQGPAVKPESEPIAEDCPPPLLDLSQSDLPSDSVGVPPVASLENLGNTCFLNSVLEVLRYTPCFLEGLGEIYRHIIYIEKVKATAAERSGTEVKTEPTLSWELVKNLFQMYKRMEKREQMFFQFANADVTSMAVQPDKILDNIREFNPMFEGNMQHDAQELLRCLLCYLEDSEKELHAVYTRIWALDPSLLKTPVKESPPALDAEKQMWSSAKDKILTAAKISSRCKVPASATEAVALSADTNDSCSSYQGSGCGKSNSSSEDHASVAASGSDLSEELDAAAEGGRTMPSPRGGTRTKKRKFRGGKSTREPAEDEVDGCIKSTVAMEVSGSGVCRLDGGGDTSGGNCCKQGEEHVGKRTRMSTRRGAARAPVDPTHSPRNSSRTKCNGKNDRSPSGDGDDCCEDTGTGKKLDPTSVDKNQPTILSMFSKRGTQTRRLGMRGRIVCLDQNGKTGENELSAEFENNAGGKAIVASVAPSAQAPNCKGGNSSLKSKRVDSSVSSSTTMCPPTNFTRNSPRAANSPVRKSPRKLATTLANMQLNGMAARRVLTDCGNQKSSAGLASSSSAQNSPAPPSLNSLDDALLVEAKLTPPPSPVHPNKISKTSAARDSQECVPPTKEKTPTRSPGGLALSKSPGSGLTQPKLMIKLENIDRLCNNSPTVSASAAMIALQTSSSAIRKVTFGGEEAGNDHDSENEEEEGRLGMKASFQCVPLKSVSVKVEKCDMVCSSPEKSVSARFATTCLARQRAQRFNMIEKLFQGSMMMRTKCLECENCTERRESFQDVSVPLKEKGSGGSDSESDEEQDSCLLRLMQAFTEVERLQDDNKYFCDHCLHKNEAERSLHYDVLPNILTVHLKRFSATTGMFGCLSKINDHVTVPLLLSCLRYKCPKPCVRADHRYTLFAIITHAGSTIMSGHYLSYIKVRPNADGSPLGYDTLATYLNNSPAKRSQPDRTDVEAETPCSEAEVACELATDQTVPMASSSTGGRGGGSSSGSRSQGAGERGDGDGLSADGDPDSSDYHWLECDDETISILSQSEFQARLSEKEGALRGTPYVLFYHRLDTWRGK